ncbi:hypothetical protein K488DRAFT_60552 [Vararia minispora EC-137]|uniref:Uncharacterized protein n=1 Tax=Vararia minispora EC-137 TaxID=1314806 RepID=A0ACB8Q8A6_9AGAM|nr:hypothetical protein K488DRAFT_60552 [Vararia minispora EC-137]
MAEVSPPQVGPLPVKRGEIGYIEELHGAAMAQMDRQVAASRPATAMAERHPADRSPAPASTAEDGTSARGAALSPEATTQATQANDANASTSGLQTMKKRRRLLPKLGGIMLLTLLKFIAQLLVLAGTGVGWAFAATTLQNGPSPQSNDGSQNGLGGASTSIFIHVAFGVVTLAELVFLERRVFRIRAERYAYVHPGEMLPRGRARYLNPSMPMAPWQRPSLPSYAAALAQSGARTGDVEDAIIAQPPPPAYGQTRGSQLILKGFFTAEHERRARLYDEEAQTGPDGRPLDATAATPRSVGSIVIVDRPSRPASYRSHDSEWEARMDMERARAVEEALAAMEGVRPAHLSDRDRP